MKTTIQILYDKSSFNGFPNADEDLKKVLFVTRRTGEVEESKRCRSMILLINTKQKLNQLQM